MKPIVYLALVITSLNTCSCIKPNEIVKKSISGVVWDTLTGNTIANTKFSLSVAGRDRALLGKDYDYTNEIYTNENGYFKVFFDAYTNSDISIVNTITGYRIWSYDIGRHEDEHIDAGQLYTSNYLRTKISGYIKDSSEAKPVKNTAFWFTEERQNNLGTTDFYHYPFYTDDFGKFTLETLLQGNSHIAVCYPDKPLRLGGRNFWFQKGVGKTEITIDTLIVPR